MRARADFSFVLSPLPQVGVDIESLDELRWVRVMVVERDVVFPELFLCSIDVGVCSSRLDCSQDLSHPVPVSVGVRPPFVFVFELQEVLLRSSFAFGGGPSC